MAFEYYTSEVCVKRKQRLYFVLENLNLLFSYDLQNKEISLLSSIPEENFVSSRLCGKMLSWKNKIILLPLNASKIWIYDIEENEWESVEIPMSDMKFKFLEGTIYNDYLYAFGHWMPGILKMELPSKKTTFIDCSQIKGVENECFGTQVFVDNKMAYLPVCNKDVVCMLNMEDDSISETVIENDGRGFTAVFIKNDHMWLASRRGQLIKCLDRNNNIKTIGTIGDDTLFYHGIIPQGNELLFPSTHSKELHVVTDYCLKVLKCDSEYLFCNSVSDDTYVTLNKLGDGKLIYYTDTYRFHINIDSSIMSQYINSNITNLNFFCKENNLINLATFLKGVASE